MMVLISASRGLTTFTYFCLLIISPMDEIVFVPRLALERDTEDLRGRFLLVICPAI